MLNIAGLGFSESPKRKEDDLPKKKHEHKPKQKHKSTSPKKELQVMSIPKSMKKSKFIANWYPFLESKKSKDDNDKSKTVKFTVGSLSVPPEGSSKKYKSSMNIGTIEDGDERTSTNQNIDLVPTRGAQDSVSGVSVSGMPHFNVKTLIDDEDLPYSVRISKSYHFRTLVQKKSPLVATNQRFSR